MNQEANLHDICTQQIQRWMDEGRALSSITAAELHQGTDAPYTLCLETLRNFTPQNHSSSSIGAPPPPAALQEVFRQIQQQIWQTVWREQQDALDQIRLSFSHEKQQLQLTAEERLSMIEKLEQALSEKDRSITDLQGKFHQQLALFQEVEQHNHELVRERDEQKFEAEQLKRQLEESRLESEQLQVTLKHVREEGRQKEEKALADLREVEQLVAERAQYTKNQELEVIRLEQQLADAEKKYSKLDLELSSEKADNAWAKDLSTEQAREINQLSQQLGEYEQEISLLRSQLKSGEQKVLHYQDEVRSEQNALSQALSLTDEQAKEIAELSRKLDAAEQEYLRVSTLYQEAKKQGTQLQKELKALLGR